MTSIVDANAKIDGMLTDIDRLHALVNQMGTVTLSTGVVTKTVPQAIADIISGGGSGQFSLAALYGVLKNLPDVSDGVTTVQPGNLALNAGIVIVV